MKNVSLESLSKLAGVVAMVATLSLPASAQQTFQSPEQAAESLAAALRAGDRKALMALLGPGGRTTDIPIAGAGGGKLGGCASRR